MRLFKTSGNCPSEDHSQRANLWWEARGHKNTESFSDPVISVSKSYVSLL